jgi:hypothetical protein
MRTGTRAARTAEKAAKGVRCGRNRETAVERRLFPAVRIAKGAMARYIRALFDQIQLFAFMVAYGSLFLLDSYETVCYRDTAP